MLERDSPKISQRQPRDLNNLNLKRDCEPFDANLKVSFDNLKLDDNFSTLYSN